MAINKVVYGDDVLVDLTPTTAEAEDVIEGKTFVNRSGVLTTGTSTGGSKDYEELDNKPSINNVELVGNKTTSDLGIVIPTVPTNLSSFTDDLGSNPTHTHSQYLTSETEPMFNSSVAKGITSSDITNWNNKSTFSGNYNDLTNKPTIPSALSELSDDTTHRVVSDTEKSNWNAKSDFSGDYNDLTNKPTIPTVPTNISAFTNDSGYISGLVMLEYGISTWQEFQNAFNSNKIVYCKVGGRMAFLAYISTSNVEFQYYRSLSSPTVSSQPDEVYVYTLTNTNVWTTTTRKASSTIDTGTGLSKNYAANTRTMTLSVDTTTIAQKSDVPTKTSDLTNDSGYITNQANDLTNYSLTTNIQTNRNLTGGVEYIVGTQESATNRWTGVSIDTGCSNGTLYTGKTIIYHLPVAGTSSAATLNLTLPDETTTGNINIYRQESSTVTTTFAAYCDILMVYDGTQWKVNAYVDTNTNTIGYQVRTNSSKYKNGASTSIYRYQLLVETEGGLEAFTSTSNKTSATKTQLSPKYILGGDIRYYGAKGEVTSGSEISGSIIWQQYSFDLRYSFNITSTQFVVGDKVYIKMSKNTDGTLSPVYSATSGGHPIVNALPTTEDGYVYLFLGMAYSGYQIELFLNHPMYEYKDGKIKLYVG